MIYLLAALLLASIGLNAVAWHYFRWIFRPGAARVQWVVGFLEGADEFRGATIEVNGRGDVSITSAFGKRYDYSKDEEDDA